MGSAVFKWKETVLGKENQVLVTVSFQVIFHIADLQLMSSKPAKKVKSAVNE